MLHVRPNSAPDQHPSQDIPAFLGDVKLHREYQGRLHMSITESWYQ